MSWHEYELIQAERLEEIKMMIEAERLKKQKMMMEAEKFYESIDVDTLIDILAGATITRSSYDRIRHVLDCALIVEEETHFKNISAFDVYGIRPKGKPIQIEDFITEKDIEL